MSLKVAAIIQARTGSTRLPGKVLEDLSGRPLLARVAERLRRCQLLSSVCIATTTTASDDAIALLADKLEIACYRGDEHDVLGRYMLAARGEQCDVVVRVTGDCPLIDPEITGRVVGALLSSAEHSDYASNIERRTYARGMDVEAFFTDVLERMHRMAVTDAEREHVTVFLRASHPELFRRTGIEDNHDNSDLRLTVDTPEDLALVRNVYAHFGPEIARTSYPVLIEFLRANPEIASLSAGQRTWTPLAGSAGDYRV